MNVQEVNNAIDNLRKLKAKQAQMIDDLEVSLHIQALDENAYDNGKCGVGIRAKGKRRNAYGRLVNVRSDYTMTINGKDYNGADLDDRLWKGLMKLTDLAGWVPKGKPSTRKEATEFRMRPSQACWDGEVSEQEWMDINKGE